MAALGQEEELSKPCFPAPNTVSSVLPCFRSACLRCYTSRFLDRASSDLGTDPQGSAGSPFPETLICDNFKITNWVLWIREAGAGGGDDFSSGSPVGLGSLCCLVPSCHVIRASDNLLCPCCVYVCPHVHIWLPSIRVLWVHINGLSARCHSTNCWL